ncbi:MAG: hypothetical protein RL605_811 [Actinomycetota bacterium]|jgi:hypothetical protein
MKKFLLFVVLVGVAALAGCTLLYPNWGKTAAPSTTTSASSSAEPTTADSGNPTPSQSQAAPKGKATVEVMNADVDSSALAINVVAHVTNVAEDGGTCTLVYQSGATTKQVTVKAESNVNDTQCYPMALSTVGLPKGAGLVSVVYDSAEYHGQSPATAITVK